MSQIHAEDPTSGAVCGRCGHDLTVRTRGDGYTQSRQSSCGRVFCSNGLCEHSWRPYPMFSTVNDLVPRVRARTRRQR